MTFKDPYYVKNPQPVKGYKAFNFDLSCRPGGNVVMYKIGKEHVMEDPPILCERGFHFCPRLYDVFAWYGWCFDTRVCEVESTGNRVESADGKKFCTDRIRIVRELSPGEIVDSLDTRDRLVRKGLSDVRDSIDAFLNKGTRYVLWAHRESIRHARKKDLPYLEERANEWTKALDNLEEKEDMK